MPRSVCNEYTFFACFKCLRHTYLRLYFESTVRGATVTVVQVHVCVCASVLFQSVSNEAIKFEIRTLLQSTQNIYSLRIIINLLECVFVD